MKRISKFTYLTEMSGYRRVNYYELCRLCTNSEGNKMNIFRDEGRRRQLQTKIHMYLHVQVMEEDSLPKIVCHDCVRKLENFAEFRQSVVNAEGMLESYFTSMNFSEECLKEGKVYVKSTEKEKTPTPEEPAIEDDPLKVIEKVPAIANNQFIASPEQQNSHQQPVLVSNINAANIQIISGVQARVQQYKCAMQMQSGGGVAAAVVEATAETHYSYQQQTSQQVSSHQQQNQSQNQITEQNQSQPSQIHQIQNQIQNQNQISQQVQSFRQISQQTTNQSNEISQHVHQGQLSQQIQLLQKQQRDLQQRHVQQIEKQQQQQQSQNNNIILKSEEETEQTQQVIQKVQSAELSQKNEINPNFPTVQASPEVFLSLGFKDGSLTTTRDENKEFKDYSKSSVEDGRNSMISEFLRLRPVSDAPSLITVNPQAVSQHTRDMICRDCGKTFATLSMLETHSCSPSVINEGTEMASKEEVVHVNANGGSAFNCDVCGKPFKRKEHLFQHRKLHSGERPYVCTTCLKAFSRKEHLVRHLVSHTGQKMHECELCGKSFSRKDNLHKHRKTHGVSGPYICETCGKSFVVKHYYLMHLTTHASSAVIDNINGGCTDPLPYKCDMCHKAFSVKQYLASHKMRHRSKNTSNGQNSSVSGQQSNGNSEIITTTTTEITSENNTNLNQTTNDSVPIQSVIERNEQQQNGSFENNHYQENITQFQ